MLNMRQKYVLLELLKYEKAVPAKIIAQKLGVSLRTIRYDIDAIDQWLTDYKFPLERTPKRGIRITNRIEVTKLATRIDEFVKPNVMYESDRAKYTILDLLFIDRFVPSEVLAENMAMSRSTILNTITELNHSLASYKLSVEGRTKCGFTLQGDELAVRHYFKNQLLNEYAPVIDQLVGSNRQPIFPSDEVVKADEVIRYIRSSFDLSAKPDYKKLRLELLLQLRRIKMEALVTITPQETRRLSQKEIYHQLDFVCQKINELFGVSVPEVEKIYLIQLLEQYSINTVLGAKKDFADLKLDDVVSELLENLQKYYVLDQRTVSTIQSDLKAYFNKYFNE